MKKIGVTETEEKRIDYEGKMMSLTKASPFNHQVRAFGFICDRFGIYSDELKGEGVALLMEMRTGKTLVAIAAVGALFAQKKAHRVLVVAPKTVLSVWVNELEKFANYKYSLFLLNKKTTECKKRLADLDESKNDLQIVLTNYDKVALLKDDLLGYSADVVIADEGHYIKNANARRSAAMHELGDCAKYKMLLTGTLISNSEADVFSQYRFVDSTVFGRDFRKFDRHYFMRSGYMWSDREMNPYTAEEFWKNVDSIAVKARLEDCLDLPKRTEKMVAVNLEADEYREYKRLANHGYAKVQGQGISATNLLDRVEKLTQFTGGYVKDADGAFRCVSHAKMKVLVKYVEAAKNKGKKIVIMAKHLAELDAIESMLRDKGIQYAVVCGSTKKRENEINRFQKCDDCLVFVGQIKVAGEGISLTAANTMIFYSMGYSVVEQTQAKNRILGVDQRRECEYLYLICRGTVDVKIVRAIKDKRKIQDYLMREHFLHGGNPFID